MAATDGSPKPRTTTVFLAGDEAGGVRETLLDWAASGLIGSCIWVSFSAWQKARPNLHDVQAQLIDPAGQQDADLGGLLARAPIDLLRFVIVHLVPRLPGEVELTGAARELLGRLRSHLSSGSELRAVNLIVPVTGVTGVDPAILLEAPQAPTLNVVASPEDRAGDSYFDAGVRAGEGGNLSGHAALAAATAAGLWTGMPVAPHDADLFPSLAGCQVVVSRAQVSSVHVEPLIDAVAEAALRPRDDWPLPAGGPAAPIAPLDPDRLVQTVLNQCGDLSDGALRLKPFKPKPAPPQERVTIWQAFARMFKFLWQRLLRLPIELGEQIKTNAMQAAETLAQGLTYGTGSQIDVRHGGRTRADLSSVAALADAQHVLEVAGVLKDTYQPQMPELWRAVRDVSFGLVQGSELPPGIDVPMAGDRRVVLTQPQYIAPDPFDSETDAVAAQVSAALGGASIQLTCGDPYAATQLRSALMARLGAVSADEAMEPAAKATIIEEINQALGALDAWTRRQEPALLWQLAVQVGRQLAGARDGLAEAEAVLARPRSQEGDERLKKAWKRCKRRWILITVVAVFGLLADIGATVSGLTRGLSGGGVVLGALVLMTWAFFAYSRVEFQVLHRRRLEAFQFEQAYDQALHYAREVVRLGSIYDPLVDWSGIIGGIARRPWGVPQGQPGVVPAPSSDGLPGALRLGVGRASDDDRASLAAGASHQFYRGTWLADAYNRFRAWSLDRMAAQQALAAPPDPDLDTPQAPNRARSQLRRDLVDDRYGQYAYGVGRAAVAEYLRGQPPGKVMSDVVPVVADGNGRRDAVTPAEFFSSAVPAGQDRYLLAEIWSDAAAAGRRHAVARCVVWADGDLLARIGSGEVQWHDIGEVELAGGGLGVKVIRVDCSQACTAEDLKLFALPDDARPGGRTKGRGGGGDAGD